MRLRSVHLFLVAISGVLHFNHDKATATLMRPPSKSECKRYARNNNACENNAAFMRLYCDKFLTCIEHDREVRDSWSVAPVDNNIKKNENPPGGDKPVESSSFYDLEAKHILGPTVKFNRFHGKVVLITNVASECGFTEQHYDEMNDLYDELRHTGSFEIMAFPCNQFGEQEPGTSRQIKEFADDNGVEFLMMQKIDVNGDATHPVYQYLKKKAGPEEITWNFQTYYVVDPDGNVKSYQDVEPLDMREMLLENFFPDFIKDSSDDEELDDEDSGDNEEEEE